MRSKKSQYELLFTFTISQKRYKTTCAICEFLLQIYHIMGKASKHGIYTARCKPLQCRHLPALFRASGQKQADSNTFPPKVHVLSNDSQLKLCLYLSSGCKRNMHLKKIYLWKEFTVLLLKSGLLEEVTNQTGWEEKKHT